MKIGFACGVFDLFHAGHVLMLKECRANCDRLIVALNRADNLPAGKNSPIMSIEERTLIVSSCRYVDEVLVYNSEVELRSLLGSRKFDIRFLGEDYRGKPITGAEFNIPIHYIDRSHGYSTTALLRTIRNKKSLS